MRRGQIKSKDKCQFIDQERHCGRVLRVLITGAEGPGFKTQLVHWMFQKLSAHPAINGYLTLFRAGEGEGGDGEEWHPHLRCQVSFLTAASPTPIVGYGLDNL